MMSKFSYKNIHEIPKIKKIVLNMGIGEAKDDSKVLDKAQEELNMQLQKISREIELQYYAKPKEKLSYAERALNLTREALRKKSA